MLRPQNPIQIIKAPILPKIFGALRLGGESPVMPCVIFGMVWAFGFGSRAPFIKGSIRVWGLGLLS